MRALVVEDDATTQVYLVHVLEEQGFEVRSAADGLAGLDLFNRFHPDVVIADIFMPGMDGLHLLERIREAHAETIVVVTTAVTRPEYAEEALRLGASNFLPKPIHHVDLVMILRKYATILNARGARERIEAMIVSQQFTMEVGNRLDLLPRVADYLVNEASAVLPDDMLLGVRLGLVELLVNAVEHGNLGITFDEKCAALEQGEDALERLRRERLAEPTRTGKRVTIEYSMADGVCEWVVRDEGAGFDWRHFMEKPEGGG